MSQRIGLDSLSNRTCFALTVPLVFTSHKLAHRDPDLISQAIAAAHEISVIHGHPPLLSKTMVCSLLRQPSIA